MSTIDVEEILASTYATLLEQASNPRQRTTLERIKAACDYFVANKMKISPTTVERYCLDRGWGGPKAQSIRNSKDVLMHYLQLRRSGHQFRERPKHSAEPEIADESLRSYVQLLKEERDQAIADRTRIQAGLRKIPGISVDALIRGILSSQGSDAAPVSAQAVPPELTKVISVLFDEERLRACGLELVKGRLRQSTTKNVLLEKTELDVLEKALQVA